MTAASCLALATGSAALAQTTAPTTPPAAGQTAGDTQSDVVVTVHGFRASLQSALNEKRKVADIVLEEGLLTREQLDDLLKLEAMTAPSRARPARIG